MTQDRLVEKCDTCGTSVDVPNKGMGRAVIGAFRSQHSAPGRFCKPITTPKGETE